ncbi:MAG: hypothetical protein GY854_35000, partial [Deltaproteobacteria bacterium]|nr:hypothetical protein [Deltaproteobacteria bacterium]
MQSYGFYAGMGVMLGYVVTITLVPLTLSFLPPPRTALTDPDKIGVAERLLDWIGDRNLKNGPVVIAVSAVFIFLAALGASRITVNSKMLSELREANEVYKDNDFAEKNLSGILSFELAIEGPEPDSIKDPRILRSIEKIQEKLASYDSILKSLSIADFLKQMNRGFHNDDPAAYTLPESRE